MAKKIKLPPSKEQHHHHQYSYYDCEHSEENDEMIDVCKNGDYIATLWIQNDIKEVGVCSVENAWNSGNVITTEDMMYFIECIDFLKKRMKRK